MNDSELSAARDQMLRDIWRAHRQAGSGLVKSSWAVLIAASGWNEGVELGRKIEAEARRAAEERKQQAWLKYQQEVSHHDRR